MTKQLKARFWALIMPILIGLFLIIYAGMGVIYFQQQQEQSDLEVLIDQRQATVSQPVELSEEEKAKYEAAQQAIPTTLVNEDDIRKFREDLIEQIQDISEEPQSDVDITSFTYNDGLKAEKVGESNYQVMLFQINIKGDHDNVMAFISILDSMTELKTFVLQGLNITIGTEQTEAKLDFGIYTLEQ